MKTIRDFTSRDRLRLISERLQRLPPTGSVWLGLPPLLYWIPIRVIRGQFRLIADPKPQRFWHDNCSQFVWVMKASGSPDFYFVNLFLFNRTRPPLAVFRVFEKTGWFQVAQRFYHVRHFAPMTAQSLRLAVLRHLKPCERVTVYRASVSEGTEGKLKPVPWDSLYQRQKETRQSQRSLRQAANRRYRKRQSVFAPEMATQILE